MAKKAKKAAPKPQSYALPHNASLEQVHEALASIVKCLALGHGMESEILSAMHHCRAAASSLETLVILRK